MQASLLRFEQGTKSFVGDTYRPETWEMGEEAKSVLPSNKLELEPVGISSLLQTRHSSGFFRSDQTSNNFTSPVTVALRLWNFTHP